MASHLTLRVLTAQELRSDDVLIPACVLINVSYTERESEGLLDRYSSPEEFLADLDADGLCAIIQDAQHENIPVALAAAKRWKGRRHDHANAGDGAQDWEIGPAASRDLPQYRRKGLIERCLQALSARILTQVEVAPVRLWVKVVEELLATYWASKGFEQCGSSYVIPVGEWHRDRSYTLVNMVKEISRGKDVASEAISRA